MNRQYPCLEISRSRLRHNMEEVISRCTARGIQVCGVIKGCSGLPEVGRMFRDCGATQLASSRLEQIVRCRRAGVPGPYMLLRIPMESELEDVARWCDYSLESEAATLDALEEACAHMEENRVKVTALRDRLIQGLSKIPHSAVNGDLEHRLPGNVSFCFEGIEGESLLLLLDAAGICASSGSACTSGSLDPSHVLLAIGRPHEVAHGSLRLSLCEWNTQEEVDHILREVPRVVEYLRSMSPVWKDLESGKKAFML